MDVLSYRDLCFGLGLGFVIACGDVFRRPVSKSSIAAILLVVLGICIVLASDLLPGSDAGWIRISSGLVGGFAGLFAVKTLVRMSGVRLFAEKADGN